MEKIKIAALYFFLIAGGLWHLLDVFNTVMSVLAGPLLMGLAFWLYIEHYKNIPHHINKKYSIWALIVIIFSYFIEMIGVKTGVIFGEYTYGNVLWPRILDVPVAIGFAWLLMLLSSIALLQRLPYLKNTSKWFRIAIAALLMTFFDFMMEPAAIKLNYWSWQNQAVPYQNYAAWFMISLIFLFIAEKLELLKSRQPVLAVHAYFAQLIYFIMVIFK